MCTKTYGPSLTSFQSIPHSSVREIIWKGQLLLPPLALLHQGGYWASEAAPSYLLLVTSLLCSILCAFEVLRLLSWTGIVLLDLAYSVVTLSYNLSFHSHLI